jgi:predicted enzyme related to lactoylglutathione lyase
MHVTSYRAGVFNWVDLQTSDLEAARSFYTGMFGWAIEDRPTPDGPIYAMAQIAGRNVCGLGAAPPEQKGIPPHWNTYVAVDNADATAGRVESLGGRLIVPPFDVMDAGRMAVLEDPEGALVSVWQARTEIGAEVVNEPNAFCWNELYSKNPDAAAKFYEELFGWTTEKHDGMGIPLRMIRHDGREIGTMAGIQSEWGPIPAHWAVYFAVSDCDGWISAAKGLGAAEFMPPKDIPGVGRFAGVADPQGAHLMVIQLAAQAATSGS